MNMKIRSSILLLLSVLSFSSCLEKLDDEFLYTFTGETITEFLYQRPETYSSFAQVLKKANMTSLLATRGSYTCFAPTNDAFEDFLRMKGLPSIDSLSMDDINEVAFSHIIKHKYLTTDLAEGAIPTANMNDRYLMVSFQAIDDTTFVVLLNKKSQFKIKDVEVVNGVVHTLNQVLLPSNSLLPDLMTENPDISIFTEALFLTGLSDSMRRYMDEAWEPMPYVNFKKSYRRTPVQPGKRYYGYTALVETNDLYRSVGIDNLEDLKAYAKDVNDRMYPEDGGAYDTLWTNPRNPLNRFVAYHLLPRTIYYNNFYCNVGVVSGCESYDYFETLSNQLIRTCNTNGVTVNRSFTMPEKGMRHNGLVGSQVLPWVSDVYDQAAINGIYHYINGMLVYDESVRDGVLNERIRIDMASLLPEMMNNNLRGGNYREAAQVFAFDNDYFDDLTCSKDTRIFYQSVPQAEVHYLQDAFFFEGTYDISLRLPPVPEGTYEIRVGIRGINIYGIAQFYVDSVPYGIPLDLSVYGHPWGWPAWDDGNINWEEEYYKDPNGNMLYLPDLDIALDKSYRNKGFMRGPAGVCMWPNQTVNRQFRWYRAQYRKIVTTKYLTEDRPHHLRIRSVVEDDSKQGMIDYIELCPKSIYDGEYGEDIY